MIRTLTAAALFAFVAAGAAVAQQTTIPPADAQVTIDPTANPGALPRGLQILTGLYATLATAEICEVTIEPDIAEGIAADRARMEQSVGFDQEAVDKAYAAVLADVKKTEPDCTDGSPDRQGIDAVTAIYASRAGQSAPAATAPATSQ